MKRSCKVRISPVLLLLVVLGLAGSAIADYDPCEIPPGIYRTQTNGGWGATCRGGNVGCIRDTYFPIVFPDGLTIGGTFTIHFTSSAAVEAFLPAGGTPGVLGASYVDPLSTTAGQFAGQVTALALSIGFGDAGVPTFRDLRHLVIPTGVHDPFGPFAGWTVDAVFLVANHVLGGDLSALPPGISLGDLNTVLNNINLNFHNGTESHDYVVEPECDEILPVELASFEAAGEEGAIRVSWRTASESGVLEYLLDRSTSRSDWVRVAAVPSQGNSASGFHYLHRDTDVQPGVEYTYRLSVRQLDGATRTFPQLATAHAGSASVPMQVALHQNWPNPFNPSTTIAFDLPEAGAVRLTVFDATGRVVQTLVDGELAAGSHSVVFDAGALAAGLYFYRLESGDFSATRRLVLVK